MNLHSPEQVERHAHIICEYVRTGTLTPHKAGHPRRFPPRMSIYALHRAYTILREEKFEIDRVHLWHRCHPACVNVNLRVIHWVFPKDEFGQDHLRTFYNPNVGGILGNMGFDPGSRQAYALAVFRTISPDVCPAPAAEPIVKDNIVTLDNNGKIVKATSNSVPIGVAHSSTECELHISTPPSLPWPPPHKSFLRRLWNWIWRW